MLENYGHLVSLGCFRILSVVDNVKIYMEAQMSVWHTEFSSFEYILRCGIAGSYGLSISKPHVVSLVEQREKPQLRKDMRRYLFSGCCFTKPVVIVTSSWNKKWANGRTPKPEPPYVPNDCDQPGKSEQTFVRHQRSWIRKNIKFKLKSHFKIDDFMGIVQEGDLRNLMKVRTRFSLVSLMTHMWEGNLMTIRQLGNPSEVLLLASWDSHWAAAFWTERTRKNRNTEESSYWKYLL